MKYVPKILHQCKLIFLPPNYLSGKVYIDQLIVDANVLKHMKKRYNELREQRVLCKIKWTVKVNYILSNTCIDAKIKIKNET